MGNLKRAFKDPRLILTFILSRYCHWMNDELLASKNDVFKILK